MEITVTTALQGERGVNGNIAQSLKDRAVRFDGTWTGNLLPVQPNHHFVVGLTEQVDDTFQAGGVGGSGQGQALLNSLLQAGQRRLAERCRTVRAIPGWQPAQPLLQFVELPLDILAPVG